MSGDRALEEVLLIDCSAYNFGLPELPCISGRELVGQVVKTASGGTRLQAGDIVSQVLAFSNDNSLTVGARYSL